MGCHGIVRALFHVGTMVPFHVEGSPAGHHVIPALPA
jgi:hypothetical protein